ncbi:MULTISPECIES: DUF4230 domain-containing protein [unclassified Pseudofrankia]|uniref:DUF4230 domain-containing protein n=1 Tax=unclassified Pseudofrankia TaxID=2994372 RepID=UPI0008DB1C8D|nr:MULTISPECIES: DUF4230 domain-containing protein [unclassified Pseudofrankia]MDT3440486.1 DUF4230 domain-containing protein [Pseudofrankia sp. BMG5.37]OHV47539.1 hypothetical protein BCD48_18015 [Pseudofrankia sp. BMG5.36]
MSDESGRSTKSTDTLPPTTPDGAAASRRGGRSARLPSLGGLIRLVALLVVLAVLAGAVSFVAGWRPSFLHNPFSEKKVDRSSPAVLRSLENISDYHAASAHLEVVVDVEDDTKWIPSSLKGERVLFVGVGTVDSVVSFSGLDGKRVTVDEATKSVTIKLPAPTLGKANLDLKRSYVVARQRGVLDRVGGLFGGQSTDQDLYVRATQQMQAAAATDGQVIALGKQNTTAMLRGLLGALGYTNITVTFEEDKK